MVLQAQRPWERLVTVEGTLVGPGSAKLFWFMTPLRNAVMRAWSVNMPFVLRQGARNATSSDCQAPGDRQALRKGGCNLYTAPQLSAPGSWP
jgi:hypothetical protein